MSLTAITGGRTKAGDFPRPGDPAAYQQLEELVPERPREPRTARSYQPVRHKPRNHFAYYTTLWQDTCEASEPSTTKRVRETGGSVGALFVSEDGTPFS